MKIGKPVAGVPQAGGKQAKAYVVIAEAVAALQPGERVPVTFDTNCEVAAAVQSAVSGWLRKQNIRVSRRGLVAYFWREVP